MCTYSMAQQVYFHTSTSGNSETDTRRRTRASTKALSVIAENGKLFNCSMLGE